ncbi:MAG: anti-sigma factor [Halofilum sp. (in: g-proteobacteria)]|nr:anti-sigma factor [Halofilum sp. (in: g-proteobacteria)]
MSAGHEQRLDELLLERATTGLDPAGEAELERLLAAADDVDPDAYEAAAAWFWLGAGDPEQPLPDDVAERARRGLESAPAAGGDNVTPLRRRARPQRRSGALLPWVAAAAALVIAVTGWWPRLQPGAGGDQADLAAARAELVESAPDLVRVSWTATENPRAQQLQGGYVVWSDALQKGYMTFRGMPDNDPSEHQYQLWVFDATRSEQYPVDGGVFNARADGGEVIIPIESKLPVRRAQLFAVTLEPPGGVVVSDRDPILWVAQPSQQQSS